MVRKNKGRGSKKGKGKTSSTPNPSSSKAYQKKPSSAAPAAASKRAALDDLRVQLEANPMTRHIIDIDGFLSGLERGDPKSINMVEVFMNMGLIDKPPTEEEMAAQKKRDEELFKDHPPQDDCPACLLPLPLTTKQQTIKLCCGATLCYGCQDAILSKKEGDICPVCSVKTTSSNLVELVKKRVELNDRSGMMVLAHIYQSGTYGLKVNGKKSGGLIEKAAKLGCPMALYNLGENHVRRHERMMSSPFGMLGVDLGTPYNDSLKKGKDYLERAAIKGSMEARFRLGKLEMELPNASDRSIKHFVIGAKAGHEPSLKYVEKAHTEGGISKDDYCEVLREYLTNSDALKSQQREKSEAYCGMMPDGELFNEDFPPGRKCPSCTVPLPYTNRDLVYMPCCGGMLCQGCSLKLCAKCPFCETTAKDDNEVLVNQLKKRMEMNDAEAYNEMGMCHKNGLYGVKQDYEKAIKMFEKAGKLGCAKAYGNIGLMYCFGDGVDKSNLKEQYYFSKASAMGDHSSRNNLGVLEEALGNHERAMKHFRIAACFGNKNAMDSLCRGLEKGLVQMDEYNKTLLAHQKAVEEVKTEEREAYRVLFDSKGDDITSDEFESAKAVWLKSAPWMKECIGKFTLKKANPES